MSKQIHHVIISIASNHEAKQHVAEGIRLLSETVSSLVLTQQLWTEPVNSPLSNRYLNQLAKGTTVLEEEELCRHLKDIERQCGRRAQDKATGIVALDLDLLEYDGERRHLRDWNRDYVRLLMDEDTWHSL